MYTGICKIGRTKNLDRKMKGLGVNESANLIKAQFFNDCHAVEKRMHKEYADSRLPGTEHFRLSSLPGWASPGCCKNGITSAQSLTRGLGMTPMFSSAILSSFSLQIRLLLSWITTCFSLRQFHMFLFTLFFNQPA